MKRSSIVLLIVALLVFAAVAGLTLRILASPEYALFETVRDVAKDGMDGLYPHLTGDAREAMDVIISVTDSTIFKLISGVLTATGESPFSGVADIIGDIRWGLQDITKSPRAAHVVISFNYQDKIVGAVTLTMSKIDTTWYISSLDFPTFQKIRFTD